MSLLTDIIKDKIIKSTKRIQDLLKVKDTLFDSTDIIDNYDQIPYILDYPITIEEHESLILPDTNCHIGQRKTLLTEIEFYSDIKHDSNSLVIYIGSASSEHMTVITTLYPNLKFLLIDPNYHVFEDKYEYIYQNVKAIDKFHLLSIKDLSIKNNNIDNKRDRRKAHLVKSVEHGYSTSFLNSEKKFNIYDLDKDLDQKQNIMKEFYTKNYKTLLKDIFDSKTNIFIIQDYGTLELVELLSKALEKTNIYFLTDIRTSLFKSESPTDVDLLWNYVLQIIFVKKLKPTLSMLKFRPTFFNELDTDLVKQFKAYLSSLSGRESNITDMVSNKDKLYLFEMMKKDFDYVKKHYNLDMFDLYLKRQMKYFKYDYIKTQPWAGSTSSEARMYISKKNIDKDWIEIKPDEWTGKFYYYNILRSVKYYDKYYNILKHNKRNQYDGCLDCSREIQILCQALGVNDLEPETIQNKLFDIYEKINKTIFFDLSNNNYKCKYHGYITKQITELYQYCAIPDTNKYIGYKINKNDIEFTNDIIEVEPEIKKDLYKLYKYFNTNFRLLKNSLYKLVKKN